MGDYDHLGNAVTDFHSAPKPQIGTTRRCFIDAPLSLALHAQSSLTVQFLDNFALCVKAFEISLALGHM